ncbi:MAG: hypothetical protein ACI9TV_000026 [Sulfurimonas sp.]|jgi:hypothetical protein|uniref:hypothetical protein n=1 Tax=Sulfurimonas sp. TaxID=2022749 RepID=UPI0039E41A7D
MNYFLQYKIIILRSLGALMLIIGFAVHFWTIPKEGLSQNDKAAARVARMEASAKGKSSSNFKSPKKDDSKFLEKLKDTQTKQMQYMTILVMVFGVGFLGYSFIPKKEDT